MWAAVALSFGLAMDSAAVSAARGVGTSGRRELAILPAVFGGFQIGMAALGWRAGSWAGPYLAAWDHWIAFGVLVLVGGKMVVEALRSHPDEPVAPGSVALYLGLGVATSIDATAAGLTLPLVPVAPWIALVLIGTITAACSAAGFLVGRAIGDRFGSKLEVLGGIVLIAIGVDILIKGL